MLDGIYYGVKEENILERSNFFEFFIYKFISGFP
jgi:hypothetical protein